MIRNFTLITLIKAHFFVTYMSLSGNLQPGSEWGGLSSESL